MKTNEQMQDTNRMAIKIDGDYKVTFDRLILSTSEEYVIHIPWYLNINGTEIDDNDLLLLRKLIFKDDQIIIDSLLIKNLNYRTIYFNNNGVIDSYYEGYNPNPEEESYAKRFNIKLTTIKELSNYLDMFKEMMKKKIIQGTPEELSKYGLYYSQISLLEKKLAKKQQI